MSELESKSLAELHGLAAEAGIAKFRMLRREELIEKLGGSSGNGSGDGPDDAGEPAGDSGGETGSGRRSRRSRRSRSRRRSGSGESEGERGETDGDGQDSGEDAGEERSGRSERKDPSGRKGEEPAPETITGVLEILSRGSGVIRGEGAPEAGIHVSPAQIRRCELESGDEVSGPVRPARRGERRPSLVRVELVNGQEPEEGRSHRFDSLTPVAPSRAIPLAPRDGDVLARAVDLLVPLAFGQRVLVQAQRRSGRTTLLKALARAILAGGSGATVSVLLVDERPEEVTAWQRDVPEAEITAAPADLGAKEQVRVAERALARVRRQAESGNDVVFMVDSLTRLGSAYGDAGSVKPFFGVGRELEEEGAGSVTVIATALLGAPGDQDVLYAVHTSENATIRLDTGLAAAGVTPAFDLAGCGVTGPGGLLDDSALQAMRRLLAELDLLDSPSAASRLTELIRGSESNEELRRSL